MRSAGLVVSGAGCCALAVTAAAMITSAASPTVGRSPTLYLVVAAQAYAYNSGFTTRIRSLASSRGVIVRRRRSRHVLLGSLRRSFASVPPNDSRSRFRLAVHATDCAPVARVVGVLRDPAVQYAARDHPRQAAGRHHPVGRPEERVRTRRTEVRPACARARAADARHLLRHAADDRHARRSGRGVAASRVRVRRRERHGRRRAAAVPRRCRPTCASGPAMATSSPPRRRGLPSSRPARTRRSRRWKRPSAATTRCCSIPKSRTPSAAPRSSGTSPSTSAAAAATGRSRRSSTNRSGGSVSRSATAASCVRCRAASIRRSPRR